MQQLLNIFFKNIIIIISKQAGKQILLFLVKRTQEFWSCWIDLLTYLKKILAFRKFSCDKIKCLVLNPVNRDAAINSLKLSIWSFYLFYWMWGIYIVFLNNETLQNKSKQLFFKSSLLSIRSCWLFCFFSQKW